jgi:hypothetical protein
MESREDVFTMLDAIVQSTSARREALMAFLRAKPPNRRTVVDGG